MTIDVAFLLELIQQHPFIYDKSKRDFKDTTKKNNAWKDIADTLSCEVVEVTTRWRTLREWYTKEMRLHDFQTQSGNGQEDTTDLKWEWYEAMGFLFSHVKPRKTIGSLVTTRDESFGSEVTEDETVKSTASTSSASSRLVEDGEVPTPTNNKKRRLESGSGGITPRKHKRSEDDIDHEVLKTLKQMELQRQEDEDDNFGKVVAAELRKIEDPRVKQIRKANIYMVGAGIES